MWSLASCLVTETAQIQWCQSPSRVKVSRPTRRGEASKGETGYVNKRMNRVAARLDLRRPLASPRPHPPLPGGPYLVVGLARSGAAIARLLAARGERVLGCDTGHPREAEGLEGVGVEVSLGVDG